MKLSMLQYACLAVTGAMKKTQTAAMEVLLGHFPPHVMNEAEDQVGINQKISGYGKRTNPTDGV
jgi:hypothetical protein